ncbi:MULTISPECIES: glutathione S-transferase family protein [Anaeromyxobacter]|uniref:glutathione S-transferase family protein n=1 Tax=Anaeromyxobacter TaxID=161492 RepID=UPI001F5811F0|nr:MULTISPECIES: glutathione S-transferase family protein [unclassified Anaeromyxobacter]
MLTLWHAWACPYCQRTRIQLDEMGLAWESREMDLARKPTEVFAMNPPLGGVPILVDGDAVIPDSLVIAQYLEERHGGEVPLLPRDALGRARTRLLFDRVAPLAAAIGKLAKGGPEARPEAERAARAALELVERETPQDGYLLGAFGLADIALAPFALRRPELSPAALGLPRLARWAERVSSRPAVRRNLAARAP